MSTLLIYHFEDNDGVGSAALIIHYLTTHNLARRDQITLLPSNYNTLADYVSDPALEEKLSQYDACYMTDISPNDAKVMSVFKKVFGENFVWIDHHKPIIDASFTMNFWDVNGLRDIGHSAFKNAWRYLYNIPDSKKDTECPPILKRLSGWDSFTFDTEGLSKDECKVVNLGATKTLKLNIDTWLKIMKNVISTDEYLYKQMMDEWRSVGQAASDELDSTNKTMCDTVGDLTWTIGDDNKKAVMVVTYGGTGSETFKSCKDQVEHALAFKRQNNGNWVVSMYNLDDKNEFHCGEYLKAKYGGGGHKGAAGCTLSVDQFIEVLKAKHM